MNHEHKNPERHKTQVPDNEEELKKNIESGSASSKDIGTALGNPNTLTPNNIMMLQRTIGNHATLRLLNEDQRENKKDSTSTEAQPIARYHIEATSADAQRVAVTGHQQEVDATGNVVYGWNYGYNIRFIANRCLLTIKTKITPTAGTSAAPVAGVVQSVKDETNNEFKRLWDNKFVLVEAGSGNRYALRTELEFVTTGEDLSIALYSGNGHDNLSEWYVGSAPVDRAHELGHQLGLLDEYIDPAVANRATGASPGVHTDHSIMGNYYNEGMPQAEAKLRHGTHIATDISGATGRTFSAVRQT